MVFGIGKQSFGALAQLGECLRGTQEVVGSSPTCSTTRNAYTSTCVGVFHFHHILIKSRKGTNQAQKYVVIDENPFANMTNCYKMLIVVFRINNIKKHQNFTDVFLMLLTF